LTKKPMKRRELDQYVNKLTKSIRTSIRRVLSGLKSHGIVKQDRRSGEYRLARRVHGGRGAHSTARRSAKRNWHRRVGITAVLQTWGHLIVPGGGIALDGKRWLSSQPRFLLPVPVLTALFQGRMLAVERLRAWAEPIGPLLGPPQRGIHTIQGRVPERVPKKRSEIMNRI
jgi:hypothetical protein